MVESSFGILAARWRIYRRPIISSISTAIKIVQATICLHNFVIKNENKLHNFQRQYTRIDGNDVSIHDALQAINKAGRANALTLTLDLSPKSGMMILRHILRTAEQYLGRDRKFLTMIFYNIF